MINIKDDRYVSARQRASSSMRYEFLVLTSTNLMISIYWISLASSRFLYSQTFQKFQSLSLTSRISSKVKIVALKLIERIYLDYFYCYEVFLIKNFISWCSWNDEVFLIKNFISWRSWNDDNSSLQEKLIDETTKYEMLSSQISLKLIHSWNIHATRLYW